MLVNKELLISAFFCSVLAGCASFAERDYVGYWTGGKSGAVRRLRSKKAELVRLRRPCRVQICSAYVLRRFL